MSDRASPIKHLRARLPARIRTPLGRVRRVARLAAVGWFYYLRARHILSAYASHYARAKRVFREEGNATPPIITSLGELGVRVVRPGEVDPFLDLPDDFVRRVEMVAEVVRSRLSVSSECVFVPPLLGDSPRSALTDDVREVRSGDVLMIQLKEPLEIPGIEELCAPLVEEIERNVFGSYATVDKVYVYRSPRSDQKPLGSWLWHYDNHPHEIVKVMVYLTDVTSQSGPFEYMRSTKTLRPLAGSPVTPLFGGSRVTDDIIRRHIAAGYEGHEVRGPIGTVTVFDDNVVHRANVARAFHRDVVVFQVRPSLAKHRPCVSPDRTGTFRHAPFSPDPEVLEPFVRRLRHFS